MISKRLSFPALALVALLGGFAFLPAAARADSAVRCAVGTIELESEVARLEDQVGALKSEVAQSAVPLLPIALHPLTDQIASLQNQLARTYNSSMSDAKPFYVMPLRAIWESDWIEDVVSHRMSGQAVQYLDAFERSAAQITIRDGKLYQAGKLLDTSTATYMGALFVMDGYGRFACTLQGKVGVIHHSSLSRGMPLAAAGTWKVTQGVLTELTDNSGHYALPRAMTEQALAALQAQGVDLSHVTVHYLAPEKLSSSQVGRADAVGVPLSFLNPARGGGASP